MLHGLPFCLKTRVNVRKAMDAMMKKLNPPEGLPLYLLARHLPCNFANILERFIPHIIFERIEKTPGPCASDLRTGRASF